MAEGIRKCQGSEAIRLGVLGSSMEAVGWGATNEGDEDPGWIVF